jgi:hypothetical protein
MPIKRCLDQSHSKQTLIEFYENIERNENSIDNSIGLSMQKLIEKLNKLFVKSEIYALTSRYDLVFVSENTWKSKWILKFITNGTEYVFYEVDKKTNEFNEKTVYTNESDLINKILDSMRKSDYWKNVPELK